MTTMGFDCYSYPGDPAIAWLRLHGQFRVAGFYLSHSPTKLDKTWTNDVRANLASAGWGFFPIYVGLQEGNAGLGSANGTAHGRAAVDLMTSAGFSTGSVVYLDLEQGDKPTGSYAAYIVAWIAAVKAKNFSPGIYCSHRFSDWSRQQTQTVWSFHIPSNTSGQSYDPDNLPAGLIDPGCIATQYRQNIKLNGLTIPKRVDSGGLDLNLCAVADPSNLASVQHALGLG
jgi:Domain of unknown function (DUF1906)